MAEGVSDKYCRTFYAGLAGGWGTTVWEGLVPLKKKQIRAMEMSTPKRVSEGGAVWGVFAGYEPLPNFAFEALYMRYPNAKIDFTKNSLFYIYHNHMMTLSTHTDSFSLAAKIMMFIPRTEIRVFSSAGIAAVHRWDMLTDRHHLSPAFGFGFNYDFNPHTMLEFALNYIGGQGQSEIEPYRDYIPFLYSGSLHLAYRF